MPNKGGPTKSTAELVREQIVAYERRGPFWGRLTQFLTALALLSGVVLSTGLASTVTSFYSGTGVIKSSPKEQSAVAMVKKCQRVGPVSVYGFGYWWRCGVTVRMSDGRTVSTTVGHSVVTPDDRGRPVEFREACFGKNNTECNYGRPTSLFWGLAVAVVVMVSRCLSLLLIIGAGFYLVRAVVGVPRYFAWLNRRRRRRSPASVPR
ncbi:DUF6346 domain-containing protein [Micromonospora coerulea]|uniref:DUF6346 domain-containing protein n=1 Tax=Micromonospora coerulea TaxID=47856 RepID=UPI0019032C03|nr:DUF6346 domain-containing protein [Micromonospora veneta]